MKHLPRPPRLAARCLMAAGIAVMSFSTQAQNELPLTGPAYGLAEQAYAAYARGDYRDALAKSREAARLRPDSAALKTLIQKSEAAQAGSTRNNGAVAPPPRLQRPARAASSNDQPTPMSAANLAADAGYQAYDGGDFSAAVTHARKAVVLDSGNRQHWLLLTHALAASGQLALAEQASQVGIDEAGDDGSLATLRASIIAMSRSPAADKPGYEVAASAYRAYQAKDYAVVASEARQAVQLSPQNLDYRRLLVDALSAQGDALAAEQAATEALALDARDASLLAQRGRLRQSLGQPALAQQDFAAALAVGSLPIETRISLLAESGQQPAARLAFDQALTNGKLAQQPPLDTAYLATQVGNDREALAAFKRADAAGELPKAATSDAGFAALRTTQDADAIHYFERRIDAASDGSLPMTPKALFDTRRAVSEVSRQYGVIASLTYRGAVSGLGQVPGSNSDSLQAGIEGYWRPWGYHNGQYVELFARGFNTLYSKGGGDTGLDTTQTAIGARFKPLRELNLIGSLSRVISPSQGRNDWLAQLAYSGGEGIDLRVDVPQWTTLRASAEVGRYLSAADTYALANLDAGKSFRVGNSRWVVFPHASAAADYDSTAIRKTSVGLGPGIGARYWFNEDRTHAPRSWVDTTLQYRFKLGGADRAEGVFVTTTLSY